MPAAPTSPSDHPPPGRWRKAAAEFWLRRFFFLAERAPLVLRIAHGILCAGAFWLSPAIRHGTRANARRILGPDATGAQIDRLARAVLSNFYLFCCEIAQGRHQSATDLARRVETIEGHDRYLRSRELRRGIIIVTAHMGSFEVGVAALREFEPQIHVVFRRDNVDLFDRARSELRARLGVSEAPLDDGWTVWIRLRDALLANQAVLLQGDRVLPGQKGKAVPFFNGHIELPLGPFKLARVTGSPVVPIFTVRDADGGIRLFVEEPIEAPDDDAGLLALARIIEKYVRAYPDQWLTLQPAWCEDQHQSR